MTTTHAVLTERFSQEVISALGAQNEVSNLSDALENALKVQERFQRELQAEGIQSSARQLQENLFHLVQQDDEILKIHSEELPPDEYYDRLRAVLAKHFSGVNPALVEHVVALVAAFDTAAAFGISFGVGKFQIAQTEVKLVGERVGREGRSANPDCIKAVIDWPAIRNLKDLQSFLGTLNYIRPFCGPAFSRVMHPLRPALKKDYKFPLTDVQLQAIEGLKGLVKDI